MLSVGKLLLTARGKPYAEIAPQLGTYVNSCSIDPDEWVGKRDQSSQEKAECHIIIKDGLVCSVRFNHHIKSVLDNLITIYSCLIGKHYDEAQQILKDSNSSIYLVRPLYKHGGMSADWLDYRINVNVDNSGIIESIHSFC